MLFFSEKLSPSPLLIVHVQNAIHLGGQCVGSAGDWRGSYRGSSFRRENGAKGAFETSRHWWELMSLLPGLFTLERHDIVRVSLHGLQQLLKIKFPKLQSLAQAQPFTVRSSSAFYGP